MNEQSKEIARLKTQIAELEAKLIQYQTSQSDADSSRHNDQGDTLSNSPLVKHASDLIFVFDSDFRATVLNQEALQFLDKAPDAVIGKTCCELFHTPGGKCICQDIKFGSEDVHIQTSYIKKLYGKWFSVHISAMYGSNSKPRSYTVFMRDLYALSAQELEYEKAVRSLLKAEQVAAIGYWEFDLSQRITRASVGARKIYGLGIHNEQLTIEEAQALPLPEYREQLNQALEQLIWHGTQYDLVFKIERKTDGAIRVIHSVAEYLADEQVVFGIIQDITEQKTKEERLQNQNEQYAVLNQAYKAQNEQLNQSQEELQLQREKYRAFYENAPLAYQSLDPQGYIIEVNPKWLEILGYQKPEVLGKWFGRFLHPDYVPHFQKSFPVFKEQGLIHDVQFTMRKKDGTFCHVSFEGCIGYTRDGRMKQTFCTFKDISDSVNAREELVRAKEEAEKSNRLKTAFLQNVSHEFRTPMNGIVGFTDLLIKHGESAQKRDRFAKLIKTNVHRLLDIVTDTVEISQVISDNVSVRPVSFPFQQAMDRALKHIREQAKEKQLPIYSHAQGIHELFIFSDQSKIERALTHILANAVKFTHKGYIEVKAYKSGDQVITEVADTGIGIGRKMQEEIFNTFTQVETGLSRNYGGNGIGLSLAKSYIELVGGKVELKSEVNQGTRVKLQVPIAAPFVEKPNGTEAFAGLQLLVVSHREDYLHETGQLLQAHEAGFAQALNSRQAIDFCREDREVALIVFDATMPHEEAFSIASLVKEFRADIPLIALTAPGFKTKVEKIIQAGFDGYLTTPEEPEKLLHFAVNYLDKQ